MNEHRNPAAIWVADDSNDDCRLIQRAFADAKVLNPVRFFHDGRALVDALLEAAASPVPALPGLVLLDLNMPLLDGRETLAAIRKDPLLQLLPVLILSTSDFSEDVLSCYRLGANSVLMKPFSYADFLALVKQLTSYWLEQVVLPVQHFKP